MEPRVILERKGFLALLKPAGLLMHGLPNRDARLWPDRAIDGKTAEPALTDWLLKNYPETAGVGDEPKLRPGLVHRLDRDTSGVVLVARNAEYFYKLKTLFQSRRVIKKYLALVRGHLERDRGVIKKAIGIRAGTTRRSVHSGKMLKEALTEYRVLERAERNANATENPGFKSTFLEVIPHTGRTHQIRVHLTSIGHPVLGDSLYGPKAKLKWVTRFMLHAASLDFELDGEKISVTAPPGRDFTGVLRSAGVSYD